MKDKFENVAREDTQALINKDLLLDDEKTIEEIGLETKAAMLKFNNKS